MRPVIRRSKLLLSLVLATLVAAIGLGVSQRWPRALPSEQFGPIRAFPAWLHQSGIAFVFSGAQGWSRADEQAARDLARAGNFVVGLNTPGLLEHLNQLKSGCVFMPGALEEYSHAQQRAAGTTRFEEPALLGRGSGATLVYLAPNWPSVRASAITRHCDATRSGSSCGPSRSAGRLRLDCGSMRRQQPARAALPQR